MFSLKVIRHADISKNELDEIIRIKSVAWPYPYEKQLEWISQHLKNSDLHLILLKNNEAVAYLNLIDIEIEIDHKLYNAFGVGNVCAIEKGKGYGNELMSQTNHYLLLNNKIGLLFCKEGLVSFYRKFGWNKVEKINLQMAFNSSNVVSMIYNCSLEFEVFVYRGQPF